MNNLFKDKFALLTRDNTDFYVVEGIMRKDKSAAILRPSKESLLTLKKAYKLRYYKTEIKTCDYIIKKYYRDEKRPLSKQLIKPIIVCLS